MIDYEATSKVLGSDVILIIKPHDNEKDNIQSYPSQSNIKIVQNENLNELMLISDKLITDYSSIFFDYMHLGKAITFYAPDYEKYRENLRNMYIDYEEENLPGEIYFNEKDLYKSLNEFKVKDIVKYKKIKKRYLSIEQGNIREKIYEKIKNSM